MATAKEGELQGVKAQPCKTSPFKLPVKMEPKAVEETPAADSSLNTGAEARQESPPAKRFKAEMAGLFRTDDSQKFHKIHDIHEKR